MGGAPGEPSVNNMSVAANQTAAKKTNVFDDRPN
jgi:hypothetical protein